MLPNMCHGMAQPDPRGQLEAVTQFRKLLSIERNPPITEVSPPCVEPVRAWLR